jgi:hypothetical protein
MSGPMPGSMDESPAVTCLRHCGNLETAIAIAALPRLRQDRQIGLSQLHAEDRSGIMTDIRAQLQFSNKGSQTRRGLGMHRCNSRP